MRSGKKRKRCSIEEHRSWIRIRYRVGRHRRVFPHKYPRTAEGWQRARELAEIITTVLSAGLEPTEVLKAELAARIEPRDAPDRLPTPPSKARAGGITLGDVEGSAVVAPRMTWREYYAVWRVDKVHPLVRKAQERDYRRHIEGYVLPALGDLPVNRLDVDRLVSLRADLLGRGLSVKYIRNILSASFRAMVSAAIAKSYLTIDPYRSPLWRRWPENQDPDREGDPEADPFTVDERQRIFGYFERKVFLVHGKKRAHPHFLAYVKLLFLSGARPSEASGLLEKDVERDGGFALIRRSFHLGTYGKTKNKRSRRTVELDPEVIAALRMIQPLHVTPEMPVFTGTDGAPIEPKAFSARWYDCLRALGIRQRGIYCMKDTFVTTALAAGVNIHWLEAQTGVRIETLKRHYWKWMRSEVPGQLAAMRAFEQGMQGADATRLVPALVVPALTDEIQERNQAIGVRGGGLEPPRVLPH